MMKGEEVKDSEGGEGRQRYLKEVGDIVINNVSCVIRRH
jgi:hypothetical protein